MTASTSIRRIHNGLAPSLLHFYEGLSASSKRTFHPLGDHPTLEACETIARDNARDTKWDLAALREGRIIGWGFLWDLDRASPTFGLAVADDCHGQGIGTALMDRIVAAARHRAIHEIVLTVVRDNDKAHAMYERRGFRAYDEFVGDDALPYYRMRLTLRES
jgi:ribosomal protein S18 acetylase RimI-like enzyme